MSFKEHYCVLCIVNKILYIIVNVIVEKKTNQMKLKILQSNFIVYFYCIVDRILFKFKKKNKNQIFLSFFFL